MPHPQFKGNPIKSWINVGRNYPVLVRRTPSVDRGREHLARRELEDLWKEERGEDKEESEGNMRKETPMVPHTPREKEISISARKVEEERERPPTPAVVGTVIVRH